MFFFLISERKKTFSELKQDNSQINVVKEMDCKICDPLQLKGIKTSWTGLEGVMERRSSM